MCFFYPFTTYPYTHCPISIQSFEKKIRAEKETYLTPITLITEKRENPQVPLRLHEKNSSLGFIEAVCQ